MIKRFKRWLIERMPVWARAELTKENEQLREKIREQEMHIKQLDAYIDGLEYGIRNQRRIIINNHQSEPPVTFVPDPNYNQPEEVKK